jgi:hypothetical protein
MNVMFSPSFSSVADHVDLRKLLIATQIAFGRVALGHRCRWTS